MIPYFTIVIVAYNNGHELQDTLDALAVQEEADFCVIILDNDCPLQSTDALNLPDTRFQIIHSTTNLGFAGGCNLASKDAKSPWLIMLNPDAQPLPNWLAEIKIGISKYNVSMFGSTQIMGDMPDLLDGFGDVWSLFGYCWRGAYGQPIETLPNEDRRVLTPCAAASVYKREFFEKLGGFDDAYFCYLEDVDLGLRMQAIGSDCIQLRKAKVIHIGGSSQDPLSDFALMQSTKNTPRLIIKNAPTLILPLMLALYILSQAWFKLRSNKGCQGQKRWDALKTGLNTTKQHLQARREIKKNSHALIFEFLDLRMKSLRTLPVQSRPMSTKTNSKT